MYDLMSDKYEYEYDNKYQSKHKYQWNRLLLLVPCDIMNEIVALDVR